MKTIELTQGYRTTISDEDFESLSLYEWSIHNSGNKVYARGVVNGKKLYIHRFLMSLKKGEYCDHANGNTLDNQRSNLRICTNSQNLANRGAQKNNTSGYKGVVWQKQIKQWMVRIGTTYIGIFKDKTEAAKAYNKAALERYGEYAQLNIC